ncbi:MarR family winged helix-turn-helix transcriptional regulator [Natrarchaeobius chitinivorans]|uniref:MarR family winged helix-turn-helix transcriptional regulator n=1 Tax=Natrarchaeobius chitinivorans TaxID=1679083 RepID=UPI000F537853|nr:MarR family winged helix-turn-helix transcriptional regulator [Natrarchaeobius chitinivorans]
MSYTDSSPRPDAPAISQARGPTQIAVLEVLEDRNEVSAREVSEEIDKSRGSVVSALYRLYHRGILKRRPDPTYPVQNLYWLPDGDQQ